jgi:hypothetical protein
LGFNLAGAFHAVSVSLARQQPTSMATMRDDPKRPLSGA